MAAPPWDEGFQQDSPPTRLEGEKPETVPGWGSQLQEWLSKSWLGPRMHSCGGTPEAGFDRKGTAANQSSVADSRQLGSGVLASKRVGGGRDSNFNCQIGVK